MSDMLYGYAGKILRVDLSTKEISTEPITKYAPKYIGGRAMGARFYWDEIDPDADAFSAGNKLIFISGPMTGTGAQGGGRSSLVTKAGKGYPKKTYFHGTAGNQFGTELKYAGYDVLIVQGISEKPVYILIEDDKVQIMDASEQWGMLIGPARLEYKRLHGEKVQTALIGPAGENLVVNACITTEYGSGFCSGGVGAVMGSKKLKAVVVNGTGKLNIARPKDLMDVMHMRVGYHTTKEGETRTVDGRTYTGKRSYGVAAYGENEWSHIHAKTGETKIKRRSCAGCSFNCRASVKVMDGSLPTGSTECVGAMFYAPQEMAYYGAENMDGLNGKVAHEMMALVEDLGLDLMYPFDYSPWFAGNMGIPSLFEQGIITKENTGLKLDEYGSREFGKDYLESLAYRRGWGALVADGDEKAIEYVCENEKFGPNRAVAKKLLEVWNARKGDFNGVDFHTLFNATYPYPPQMDFHDYNLRLLTAQTDIKRAKDYEPSYHVVPSEELVAKWLGTDKVMQHHYWGKEIAEAAIIHEANAMEPDALGLCCYLSGLYAWYVNPYVNGDAHSASVENAPEHLSSGEEYWNAVMGTDVTQEYLNEQYSMCRHIEAAIFAREATHGKNRENYQYHDWIYDECKDSNGVLSMPREEYERTLSQYFELRGWDENGIPTRETLEKCGLKDIADELDARGVR